MIKKMRRIIATVLLGGLMSASDMRYDNIVNWQSRARKINGQQYELEFRATISEGWYIYSMQMKDGVVEPVSISFLPDPAVYELAGPLEEKANVNERLDPQFNSTIFYITDSARYLQPIRRLTKKPFTLRGSITYMGCDPTMCLPPQTDSFSIRFE
jgi:hypothetical protein